MTDASTDAPRTHGPRARRPGGLPAVALALGFAVLYAYDLWEAVSNAVSLPQVYSLYGLDTAEVPWVLLVAGMLLPVVVFAVAAVLGRGRALPARALLFAVGLALVAVLSLDLVAIQGRLLTELFSS
jgi:hypothetical protein